MLQLVPDKIDVLLAFDRGDESYSSSEEHGAAVYVDDKTFQFVSVDDDGYANLNYETKDFLIVPSRRCVACNEKMTAFVSKVRSSNVFYKCPYCARTHIERGRASFWLKDPTKIIDDICC